MKLIDLLETQPRILDRKSSEEPFVIAATRRFIRNYQDYKNHPVVKKEFKSFLDSKERDINLPFGKKDSAWVSDTNMVIGLKGWWHAHLFYGKAIVIYKPVGNRLILANITDHKSVEGEGNAIQRLGEYLQTVDQGLAGANTNANSTVTNLTDRDLVDMGVKKPQEPGAPKVDLKELESFIYTAATNDQDRQLMIAYRNGENDEFREFLELVPGAVTLPRDQVNTIINRALKYIAD